VFPIAAKNFLMRTPTPDTTAIEVTVDLKPNTFGEQVRIESHALTRS
jgi:hypothetical protein